MGEVWRANYCDFCVNDINQDCDIYLNLLMGYDEHITSSGGLYGDCSEFKLIEDGDVK
jgi:hypothetical protein